jgi:uridine kinase
MPRPIVLVDGLWLLWKPSLRALFDLSIFVDSPEATRRERRARRDVAERGRTLTSVHEQFSKTVAPMHNRFVAPQIRHVDIVLKQPVRETHTARILRAVKKLTAPRARSRKAPPIVPPVKTAEIFIGGALDARLSKIPAYALAS